MLTVRDNSCVSVVASPKLIRSVEPGAGLPLKTNRYYFRSYPDTFEGSCLVSWLIGQDSHATSRAQAVAIGQALLTAGFIRAISGQLQFTDSSELFTPGQPHIQEEEQGDASPLLMVRFTQQEMHSASPLVAGTSMASRACRFSVQA